MKLARLPDRSRVRLNVQVSPALLERLKAYAGLYEKTYGTAESVEALLPYMIEAFLASDPEVGTKPSRRREVPVKAAGNPS